MTLQIHSAINLWIIKLNHHLEKQPNIVCGELVNHRLNMNLLAIFFLIQGQTKIQTKAAHTREPARVMRAMAHTGSISSPNTAGGQAHSSEQQGTECTPGRLTHRLGLNRWSSDKLDCVLFQVYIKLSEAHLQTQTKHLCNCIKECNTITKMSIAMNVIKHIYSISCPFKGVMTHRELLCT